MSYKLVFIDPGANAWNAEVNTINGETVNQECEDLTLNSIYYGKGRHPNDNTKWVIYLMIDSTTTNTSATFTPNGGGTQYTVNSTDVAGKHPESCYAEDFNADTVIEIDSVSKNDLCTALYMSDPTYLRWLNPDNVMDFIVVMSNSDTAWSWEFTNPGTGTYGGTTVAFGNKHPVKRT